ncbi:MAG: capsular biosynthesis protein, partial [Enterobacterales bacterium]|nr:capsular biosynthesis protein [Enterobacterales bacterium]
MSINSALWLQIYTVVTLVFCGVVQYFTGILAVLWLPVVMAFVTTGFLLMQTRRTPLELDLSEMMVLVIYLCFVVLALISTVLQGGITVTIIGIKNEVGMSLVLFCLLLGFCRESQIFRISRLLYWIFYAQFPLVIYQVLIVLPQRVAMRGEDEK